MRGEFVAFDLETTGLDIHNDSIIEIGAVLVRDGDVISEYSTLINPGFVIPQETTLITGIEQNDLRDKPALPAVLPDIEQFIGSRPVVAHNTAFDVGFLNRFGLLKTNTAIDTFELATILLPRVPRYNLGALAENFGISLTSAHRALDDARATAHLYLKLWERALSLPPQVIDEILRGATNLDWELKSVFEMVSATQQTDDIPAEETVLNVFKPLDVEPPPLPAPDTLHPISSSTVDKILGSDGKLAHKLTEYEFREQQINMAHEVAGALNNGEHIMIEAGTGTGKSIAYLVPSALFAGQNETRVVISTNTINLQDQLLNNDIPTIADLLDQPVSAAVMKGRSNYLCPRRLNAVRRRSPSNTEELRILAKILVWLQESDTGDRGELSLRAGEHFSWQRLSAQDEGCHLHRCSTVMQGACPFYKARKRAEAANLLIVNHALLVSDAASENRVLPAYQHLVIDEAHQLEDAVTNGMGVRIDMLTILRRLNELGNAGSGIFGDLLSRLRGNVPEREIVKLEDFAVGIADAAEAMGVHVRRYFKRLFDLIQAVKADSYKLRIDDTVRGHGEFATVQGSWQVLSEYFEVIGTQMHDLAHYLPQLADYDIPDFDDHVHAAASVASFLIEVATELTAITENPEPNTIYWLNNGSAPEYISVQTAPLHVGPLVDEFLWRTKRSIIMTSATLRTSGSFDHIRNRLYAEDTRSIELGSPFDYRSSTLVYVPEDMPMPHANNYQRAVERCIVELATALNGRVMVLFTSYAQLKETAGHIGPRLALGNIIVFDQATGGSRESLLDSFKTTEKAVLLGTRSFWEGVDIPGDDLSALVIVRLPFAVPFEPVFASRSETYQDSFHDFAVPDAILRFRQGFGRLIRTRADRGIVAILDSRIVHKRYGQQFLDSLPDATVKLGSIKSLADDARAWLDTQPQDTA